MLKKKLEQDDTLHPSKNEEEVDDFDQEFDQDNVVGDDKLPQDDHI